MCVYICVYIYIYMQMCTRYSLKSLYTCGFVLKLLLHWLAVTPINDLAR